MNRRLTSLLIADADDSTRLALRAILGRYEFAMVEASSGEEALSLVDAVKFDIVMLDIDIPGMDGIEVCRLMRECWPRLPIIMLARKGSDDRNVMALETGADDLVTKPLHMRELVARLRLSVRRSKVTPEDERETAITIGRFHLDPVRHLFEKDGKVIRLTPKEFELLHYLMTHAGSPIPHARLLRSVWGAEYGNEMEYLRTYIRQIRIKVEDDPANPTCLVTEPYIGYRFAENTNDHH